MHLLHRSSMFSADGGGRAPRRVGSSPRRAPTRAILSRSECEPIKKKKKSGGGKLSKRARLRAGLAAALQELRLAGRKHGPRAGDHVQGGSCCYPAGAEAQANGGAGVAPGGGRGVSAAAGGWPPLLLVAVLALACVVALGRAPAVCCCTCAAWLCRGPPPLCGSFCSCLRRPAGAASPLRQRGAVRLV